MHGVISTTHADLNAYLLRSPVRWYGLLIESGKERRIGDWLKIHQYQFYWPRFRAPLPDNRGKLRDRSVIPGYFFVPVPINRTIHVRLLEEYPHIRRVMRSGDGHIVEIVEYDIEMIRKIEVALNESKIAAEEGIPFKVGDIVYVPTIEKRAKITKLDGRHRIEIEVDMFNQKVKTFLPVSKIESI